MSHLMAQIEENYVKWKEESKIWPQQKDDEFAKIKKYLTFAHHEPLRSQGSRMSIDVPINVVDSPTTFYLNQPANETQEEQHNHHSAQCTDL